MSALDRALIRAYRQQRGGAASCQPQPYLSVEEPYAPHAAESELAGPHYRIDGPHAGVRSTQASEDLLATSSLSAGEWTTFRVDIGVTDMPNAPKFLQPAESEPAMAPPSADLSDDLAALEAPAPQPSIVVLRPAAEPVRLTAPLSIARPEAMLTSAPSHAGARPQLVVDRFLWPELCDKLDQALRGSSVPLKQQMNSSKHRAVAIAGTDPGAGVSTALLTVARHLVAESVSATVMDANFSRPALAEMLGVVVNRGWDAALDGKTPLDEVLIESNEERLVLAPWAGPSGMESHAAKSSAIAAMMQSLHDLSEILLIDAGPLDSDDARNAFQSVYKAASLDGVYLVCDRRRTTPQEVVGLIRELKSSGISVLGTIENFCLSETAGGRRTAS
jgi:Mrp family chromosome partitioning ATPase